MKIITRANPSDAIVEEKFACGCGSVLAVSVGDCYVREHSLRDEEYTSIVFTCPVCNKTNTTKNTTDDVVNRARNAKNCEERMRNSNRGEM